MTAEKEPGKRGRRWRRLTGWLLFVVFLGMLFLLGNAHWQVLKPLTFLTLITLLTIALVIGMGLVTRGKDKTE